jgi:hypothetical protein
LKRASTLLLPLVALIVSCGGGTKPPATTSPANVSTNGLSPSSVRVAVDQTTSGVDVTVAAPASSTRPNAESLGTGTSATNTGITISRSSSPTIILFGHGLTGTMKVHLTGPNDIAVSNIRAVTATDGTPGITFTAAVDANAALGARSVILQDTNNDITAYAGGLEVVP